MSLRHHAVCLSFVACLFLALPALAEQTATVRVIPGAIIAPVNPFIFGNNQLAYQASGEFSGGQDLEYAACGAGIWDPATHAPVPE